MNFLLTVDEWLAIWNAWEPLVSSITGIAGLLALLWGVWTFVRWKVVPFTLFGFHVTMINTLMRQTQDVFEFEEWIGGKRPEGVAALAGRAVLQLVMYLAILCCVDARQLGELLHHEDWCTGDGNETPMQGHGRN